MGPKLMTQASKNVGHSIHWECACRESLRRWRSRLQPDHLIRSDARHRSKMRMGATINYDRHRFRPYSILESSFPWIWCWGKQSLSSELWLRTTRRYSSNQQLGDRKPENKLLSCNVSSDFFGCRVCDISCAISYFNRCMAVDLRDEHVQTDWSSVVQRAPVGACHGRDSRRRPDTTLRKY